VAAAALLVLLLVPITAVTGRWWRRRRAKDDQAVIEAAWADLQEQTTDLGVPLPVGSTPRQLAAIVAEHVPEPGTATGRADDARAALLRACSTVERSRYSRPGSDLSSGTAGSAIGDDVRTVVRQVAKGRTRRERLTARLLPVSGRRRLGGWTEQRGRQVARVDLGAARGARLLLPRRRRA
jgi:hypothetical protein